MRRSCSDHISWLIVAIVLNASFTAFAGSLPESTQAQVPDLKVVGWTIDDSVGGNGDGGLQPGETAFMKIYLTNRGKVTARNVSGQLFEAVDHPEITILDKLAIWPDVSPTAVPVVTLAPHFEISAGPTLPCSWEIPLRLELTADNGYFVSLDLTLVMVDPGSTDLIRGSGRPFYYGAGAGDKLGTSVTSGDLDGDGYDDLVIGAETGAGPANNRPAAGEVTIIYGGPARAGDTDLATPPSGVAVVYGAEAGDNLGKTVAAHDLDGDGFEDLILPAPGGDGAANIRTGGGDVYILYGSLTRLPASTDLLTPPVGVVTIYGVDPGDAYGSSVTAGDFDGDGFDDLVLGAAQADGPSNARSAAGDLAVIYGGPVPLSGILDLATPPAGTTFIRGADTGDQLGSSIAAGDVDGDGYDDLIAGAFAGDGPLDDRLSAGEVAVIYGGPTMLPTIDLATPPVGTALIYGGDVGDLLGFMVATGDLDGDGTSDLLLGARDADGPSGVRGDSGEVVIIFGDPVRLSDIDLASPPPTIEFVWGADSSDGLSSSITAADLDGDGYDEIVVGGKDGDGPANGRASAGEVAIVRGSPARGASIDLATPPPGVELIYGADAGDALGNAVAAGDLDGDGFLDLILGSNFADGPGNTRLSAGDVVIIPGEARSAYRHGADTYSFIDATIGTNLGLVCDDCSASIPIGFDFNFYGLDFDTVTVSSNGYLTFGGSGNRLPDFCLPSGGLPNDLVAVLWDDWNPSAGGAVWSLIEGTAPNRRLTIEWAGVPAFPAVGAATFEVTLFESLNQILLQYQDVTVGGSSDNGATAIVGVENGSGLNGSPYSCFTPSVSNTSALRFRRFSSPIVVYSNDAESGTAGFTASGLWHIVTSPTCAPSSRSGASSWYYGQNSTCTYDTAAINSGDLTSPVLPALAQDASLRFWQRRSTEGTSTTFDQSLVQVQANGGGFNLVKQITENSNKWRRTDDFLTADPLSGSFATIDLSSYAGQNVELRFRFDTVQMGFDNFLGWMVDDITVSACPVFGVVAAAQARATAQSGEICETSSGRVDAVGSYCAACSVPLDYQWKENGSPIGGATGVVYDIASGHPPGQFDYTVAISCPANPSCVDESLPAPVAVVDAPVAVGATFMLAPAGTDIDFTWSDVTGADDYALYTSLTPIGGFTNVAGSAVSGVPGITLPVPPDPIVYYLVAGRNPVCGTGPQR